MRPLVQFFDELQHAVSKANGLHMSVVGSATRTPTDKLSEIDVYIVLSHMTRHSFDVLQNAAKRCALMLADVLRFEWIVETRRGPLKPDPDEGRCGQIHLLMDDAETLTVASEVTLLDWSNNGTLVGGEPIYSLRSIGTESTARERVQECIRELAAMRQALLLDHVQYKVWFLDGAPALRLVDEPLGTPWMRRCMLKYCTEVSQTIFELARSPSARARGAKSSVVGCLRNWRALDRDWNERKQAAIVHLDRLIKDLKT